MLESDTAYEARRENDGAPMDIWRLDFSVRNGSGRWLDHLIGRFQIESEWPDCTNWDRASSAELANGAWYFDNSEDRTQPVGQKAPNAWGLHDMLGNVYEWVADWYDGYPGGVVTGPRGPVSGAGRLVRGGNWNFHASYCRSSTRIYGPPGGRFSGLGFRLLGTVP